MTHRLVLLGSPFLGPEVWEPVATRLGAAGHLVEVVAPRGGSPEEVLADLEASVPRGPEPVTLVPHSNAGLYVAALSDSRPVDRIVFVDALIPGAGPTTPVSPPALAQTLAPLADADGLLPGWTHWWPEADTVAMFPDEDVRDRVEAGQPRLPATYLNGSVPTPTGWQEGQVGYLGFGDAYADEAALARSRGWPTTVIPGRHLHMLVDPVEVAEAIRTLVRGLVRGA